MTETVTPAASTDTTMLGGEVKTGEVKTGEVKTGEVKTGEVKTGEVKTGEVKTGEVKTGEVKTGAPEKYDLKLPENTILDPAAVEGIAAFARELDLSPEAAQKLVERDSKMLDQFAEHVETQVQNEHKDRVANWAKEVRESKDLGGEKYTETTFLADKAVRMFATPELKAALNETGFGNHPELVRLFAKIGKALAEDSFTTRGADDTVKTDAAKAMFPTMN